MTDDLAIDFDPLQTLGFLITDWVEQHCLVPGGVMEGQPLVFNGWQLLCTVNHYRVKPRAKLDPMRVAEPFVYRRSIVVGPQKCGKSPWGAAVDCGYHGICFLRKPGTSNNHFVNNN